MFDTGMTKAQILSTVQTRFQRTLDNLAELERQAQWAAGVQASDLTAIGFGATDASVFLTAVADANAAAAAFVISGPMRQVLGPQ